MARRRARRRLRPVRARRQMWTRRQVPSRRRPCCRAPHRAAAPTSPPRAACLRTTPRMPVPCRRCGIRAGCRPGPAESLRRRAGSPAARRPPRAQCCPAARPRDRRLRARAATGCPSRRRRDRCPPRHASGGRRVRARPAASARSSRPRSRAARRPATSRAAAAARTRTPAGTGSWKTFVLRTPAQWAWARRGRRTLVRDRPRAGSWDPGGWRPSCCALRRSGQ